MIRRFVLLVICVGIPGLTAIPRFVSPEAAAYARPVTAQSGTRQAQNLRNRYTTSRAPTLSLSPVSGTPGISVHASGNLTTTWGNGSGQLLWDNNTVLAHFYTGPAGGYAANFSVPAAAAGSHTVTVAFGASRPVSAVFTVAVAGSTSTPRPTSTATSTPTPTPTSTPAPTATSVPPSPSASWKGVNWGDPWGMWCWTGTGGYAVSSCKWSGIESDLADMRSMGITWARMDFYQNVAFAFYDQLMPLFARYGITPIVLLHKSDPANDLGTATQQTAYQTWLAAAIDRYHTSVTYWEVQNEENLGQFWSINESTTDDTAYLQAASNYVDLLRLAYTTIKAHDPSAQVLLGGVSDDYGLRYIDALESLNAARYFDIFAYHPYEATPANVVSRVAAAKAELAKQPAGMGAKPFWITEVGFYCTATRSSFSYACNETNRAQYLSQTLQSLRANGVTTPIVWYDLHDHGASTTYGGYGLEIKNSTTYSTTQLPVYSAYKSIP